MLAGAEVSQLSRTHCRACIWNVLLSTAAKLVVSSSLEATGVQGPANPGGGLKQKKKLQSLAAYEIRRYLTGAKTQLREDESELLLEAGGPP